MEHRVNRARMLRQIDEHERDCQRLYKRREIKTKCKINNANDNDNTGQLRYECCEEI